MEVAAAPMLPTAASRVPGRMGIALDANGLAPVERTRIGKSIGGHGYFAMRTSRKARQALVGLVFMPTVLQAAARSFTVDARVV